MQTPRKFISGQPNYLDISFYFITLIFCYFCFNQSDILRIAASAFTYLDGHILDFYEANNNSMGGGTNYLPSVYLLFALWNLPLKLLGIAGQGTMHAGPVIFWYKLLPLLFLAGASIYLYKIAKLIGLSRKNATLLIAIWLSSPILFFGQFIFGQCDIFYTFFSLIGLYYYLKKNIRFFILFFGLAFTFKYFPLFVFIPLLLLIEKRPFKLVTYMALALLPVALELIFYISSAAFNSSVLGWWALPRLYLAQIGVFPNVAIFLFLFVWFIICGICYYLPEPENKNVFYQTSFYICLAACSVLFIFVFWHPQWLIFITPFLAVTTFMSKKIREFLFFDFLMMVAFVGFTVIFWQMNVDQHMFNLGVLGKFNPGLLDPNKTFRMAGFFTLGSNEVIGPMNIYFTLFCSLLALNILLKFPSKNNAWEDNNIAPAQDYWDCARLRFFGGMAAFIVPALIAYFYTLATP